MAKTYSEDGSVKERKHQRPCPSGFARDPKTGKCTVNGRTRRPEIRQDTLQRISYEPPIRLCHTTQIAMAIIHTTY